MAEYLNPADRVADVGKAIDPKFARPPHGHVLVGVYDNGVRRIAPVLSGSEMEHFENQYKNGWFLSRSFFSVPVEKAREIGARL